MFRRTFLAMLAGLFGSRVAAQAPGTDDGLSPVMRNGKEHARFFRRGPDKMWREVEPEDIKHGDDIIALAVENGALWIALRSVINDIWVDPKDGVWTSFCKGGTKRLDLLSENMVRDVSVGLTREDVK